jgi:hypothetical protein
MLPKSLPSYIQNIKIMRTTTPPPNKKKETKIYKINIFFNPKGTNKQKKIQ